MTLLTRDSGRIVDVSSCRRSLGHAMRRSTALIAVALALPAGAAAAVTSLSAGAGIALSPDPITSSGMIALQLPLALSDAFDNPFVSLVNTGSGDALDATGPVGLRAQVNGSGKYAVIARGGSNGAGLAASSKGGDGAIGTTSTTFHAGLRGMDTSSGGGYGGHFSSYNGTGVYGTASNSGYGGWFTSATGTGVLAQSNGFDGVQGQTTADHHAGISGGDTSSAGGYGGYFSSANGDGVYASAPTAGYFAGDVSVTGSLDAGAIAIDGPFPLPLVNGWTTNNGAVPGVARYWRTRSGEVQLEGSVTEPSGATSLVAGVLPPGFRPPVARYFPQVALPSSGYRYGFELGVAVVFPNGNVQVDNVSWKTCACVLDGIQFSTR